MRASISRADLSFSFSSGALGETSEAAPITSATPIAPNSATVTRAMLRKLFRAPIVLGLEDDERGPCGIPFRQRLRGGLGRGSVEGGRVDQRDAASLGVDREGRAHRLATRFAIDLDHEVARLGAEGDAAADPVRNARGRRRGRGRCPSGATPSRSSSRPRRGSGSTPSPAAGRRGRHEPSRARASGGRARRRALSEGRLSSSCRGRSL